MENNMENNSEELSNNDDRYRAFILDSAQAIACAMEFHSFFSSFSRNSTALLNRRAKEGRVAISAGVAPECFGDYVALEVRDALKALETRFADIQVPGGAWPQAGDWVKVAIAVAAIAFALESVKDGVAKVSGLEVLSSERIKDGKSVDSVVLSRDTGSLGIDVLVPKDNKDKKAH